MGSIAYLRNPYDSDNSAIKDTIFELLTMAMERNRTVTYILMADNPVDKKFQDQTDGSFSFRTTDSSPHQLMNCWLLISLEEMIN